MSNHTHHTTQAVKYGRFACFYSFSIIKMKNYIDLTNGDTYQAVETALIEYWFNKETFDFAFDIYGLNEQTLENLLYWRGIDEDEFLRDAWLLEDDDEDDEE